MVTHLREKPDKDEIRIRLGLSALMGLLGPKGVHKVGPKAAHLRGYINRGGRLKTLALLLFTVLFT